MSRERQWSIQCKQTSARHILNCTRRTNMGRTVDALGTLRAESDRRLTAQANSMPGAESRIGAVFLANQQGEAARTRSTLVNLRQTSSSEPAQRTACAIACQTAWKKLFISDYKNMINLTFWRNFCLIFGACYICSNSRRKRI